MRARPDGQRHSPRERGLASRTETDGRVNFSGLRHSTMGAGTASSAVPHPTPEGVGGIALILALLGPRVEQPPGCPRWPLRALKELAFYLMSNPAASVSFNKLKEQLRLGSVNTVKNYLEYLENSWLIFTSNVYDYSVKRQQVAPKKVYAIDTGLVNAVGFSFSPNTGKLLENLVYLALRRRTRARFTTIRRRRALRSISICPRPAS